MKNKQQVIDGNIAEDAFKKLFIKAVDSTKEQDIKDHWDVKVELDGQEVKVDIKSIKRTNRYDASPNENFHWVELINVNGDTGWLYGDSDLIAFETQDYFILVGTLKLRRFIEKMVGYKQNELNQLVISTTKDVYRPYQRKGRKDVIIRVKTIDLMHIRYQSIKKV